MVLSKTKLKKLKRIFIRRFKTDTYPGRCGVATHPVTAKIIDHTREGRIAPLRYGDIFQREDEIRLECAHCRDLVGNGNIFISIVC